MHNQTGIKNYAKNASARGKSNLNKLLLWVFRWGWTSENVIQVLLNLKRRPCYNLVNRGILRKITPPPGFPAAYVIGHAYLDLAHDLHEVETGLTVPYPYHRQAIPFADLGLHNEGAQLCALHFLQEGDYFLCERELRIMQADKAVPDFLITDPIEEKTVWYEYERTPKYGPQLTYQLQLRSEALAAKRFSRIIWCCSRHGIMRNIVRKLEQQHLPRMVRAADGSLRTSDSFINFWDPSDLNSHSGFATECEDF
jgi:hypothetical protein